MCLQEVAFGAGGDPGPSVSVGGGAQGSRCWPRDSHFSANCTLVYLPPDQGRRWVVRVYLPPSHLHSALASPSPKSPEDSSSGFPKTLAQVKYPEGHSGLKDTEQARQPRAPVVPGEIRRFGAPRNLPGGVSIWPQVPPSRQESPAAAGRVFLVTLKASRSAGGQNGRLPQEPRLPRACSGCQRLPRGRDSTRGISDLQRVPGLHGPGSPGILKTVTEAQAAAVTHPNQECAPPLTEQFQCTDLIMPRADWCSDGLRRGDVKTCVFSSF